MHGASIPLLVLAAAVVAVVHSILPDHWIPLAVVARTNRWSLARVARVSALAASGHVVVSVLLAGVVAAVGLAFQKQIETQQGHIVGAVLLLTGLGFLLWGLSGRGGGHGHAHVETHGAHDGRGAASRRLASVVVPFGVAASPDLTILPIALAAGAFGGSVVAGALVVFALLTVGTFVGLTVLATLAGYRIKGEWLERHANTITAVVLVAIGAVAFAGF